MKYNICVPIQVKSGDIEEIKRKIKRILDVKPELIEFRFDYIDDIVNLSPLFLKDLLVSIPTSIFSIFTFRVSSEGGQIDIDLSERLKIITLLIEAKPSYFDIEMKTDLEVLRTIINLTNSHGVKLIFSYHDLEKTPSYEKALSIFENFKETLLENHIVDFLTFKKLTYKFIFTAKNFEDNLIPIKLCKTISEKEKDQAIISFCMGELGILSRILCVKFGSFLTFGSYEEETAIGQVHVKIIREIHQLLFDNKN